MGGGIFICSSPCGCVSRSGNKGCPYFIHVKNIIHSLVLRIGKRSECRIWVCESVCVCSTVEFLDSLCIAMLHIDNKRNCSVGEKLPRVYLRWKNRNRSRIALNVFLFHFPIILKAIYDL